MNVFQWIGFAASLVTVMLCGIALSFNVYAVKLKTSFQLDQWQIELQAASVTMGWSFLIVLAWVVKKFGYNACYILVLLLTTSSSLLMWLSTQYVQFFRQRVWLMCVFLFMNTSGTGGGIQCLSSIGVQKFSPKHTGKVIGLYMAVVGLGKVYYSLLFQLYFQSQKTLAPFFVSVAVTFACAYLICCIFHKQHEDDSLVSNSQEDDNLQSEGTTLDNSTDALNLTDKMSDKSELRKLLSSSYFNLMSICFVIFQATTITFMNNITLIAESVGSANEFDFVYILSVMLVTSRVFFGVLYDYYDSVKVGLCCLLLQYLLFCFAMLIGIFCLDEITIYVLVVLASIGCGGGYSLPISMMTSEFGTTSYPLITGVLDLALAPVVLGVHLSVGLIYDYTENLLGTKTLFCKPCFKGSFIIFLSCVSVVILLQLVNFVIYYKKSRLRCMKK